MSTETTSALDIAAIPNEYFEVDENGSKLVALVNFELRDAEGNFVAIDKLSEMNRASCVGEALMPYSEEWRDRFAAIAGSAAYESPPPEPQYYYIESHRDGATTSTRFTIQSLLVQATVDLYSPATHSWHSATVLETNKSLRLVHVHYDGWAEECSEWIEYSSQRIAPAGYYTSQTPTVPYSDYDALLTKARDTYGGLPQRQTVKVRISDIVDWCIDYAYCYPSLWVITADNLWVRLAGALHPPCTTAYAPTLAPTLTLFDACCHFAHILYDIVIRRQKMPLEEILKHIYLRSKGRVKEDLIYENHEFIMEQMIALEPMNYEGTKHRIKSYENCPFMPQLKKTAKQYMRSGKKAFVVSYHTILSDGTRKPTKASVTDNNLYEDKVFWMNEKQRGVKVAPFPTPASTPLLTPTQHLPSLYQCYAMLMNYRNMLHIPVFSIKSLERCLMAPQLHPFVTWLHSILLNVVVSELDVSVTSFVLSDEPEYKPSHTAMLLHPPTTTSDTPRASTIPLPTTGSWLEALRIYLSIRSNRALSCLADPMGDLLQILTELTAEAEYAPLLQAGNGVTLQDVIFQLSLGSYEVSRSVPLSISVTSPQSSTLHTINQTYDVYHPLLQRWTEASLISVEQGEAGNVLEFALPGWEDVFNIKYPEDSDKFVRHTSAIEKLVPTKRERSQSITRHFQHGIVADQVKSIVLELQSQFGDICDAFLRQFDALYEVRIIQAHDAKLPQLEATCPYWLNIACEKATNGDMLQWLSNLDYDEISFDQRLHMLQWLVDEVVMSDTGRQYLDSVMAFHGNKRKTLEGDITGIDEVQLRLDPLGTDRNDRVYWHFPCDEHVVIVDGAHWVVANRDDTLRIIDWLSDRGIHESQLKTALSNLAFVSTDKVENGHISSISPSQESLDATPHENEITPTQKTRKKRKTMTAMVYDCLDDIADQWEGSDPHIPSSIPLRIQLSAQHTLELGIKEIVNRICATSYVFSNGASVAKTAGVCIGDQLHAAEGEILYGISHLHTAMRNADGSRKREISTLILRYYRPLSDSMLMRAYDSDLQFRTAYDAQVQQNVQAKQIKYNYYKSILHDVPMEPVLLPPNYDIYPSKLFGCLLNMFQLTRFPYATGCHWRHHACTSLMSTAISSYQRLSAVKSTRICLKTRMIDMLLGLENALFQGGRALTEDWVLQRRRNKWALNCRRAVTYAQIAACASTLHEAITFDDILDSTLRMEKHVWEKLVPRELQVKLPAVSSMAVYYAEGHYAALQAEEKLGVPDTCIDADYMAKVKLLADSKTVMQCYVSSVQYICGGSRVATSGQCYPFALYELKVVPTTIAHQHPKIQPPRSPYKRTNRLLLRILGILMALPEANSVIRINDKNYSSVIQHPVSLEFMRGKAKASQYKSPDEFMQDLTTLRENTAYYYKSPAPSDRMTTVYNAAEQLIKALKPEFMKPATCTHTNDKPLVPSNVDPNLVLRVSVRLAEGFPEYLVSDVKYTNACSKTFYLEDDFQMRFATDTGEKSVYQGMIVGSKPERPDGFVPWDWLQVEWDAAGDEHFSEVNPWEIEQKR